MRTYCSKSNLHLNLERRDDAALRIVILSVLIVKSTEMLAVIPSALQNSQDCDLEINQWYF
jgi:hypothetical protein